jgi:hypothetical protein
MNIEGHLAFVAYLYRFYERGAGRVDAGEWDWPPLRAASTRGQEGKIRIATKHPFTELGDPWTPSTGHRKLPDILKVIENNAPTQ